MIILRLLLLLTNLHLKLLSTQGTGADKLLSTQRVKRAAIVPIFKSGDKTQASNYRPISLTSVVCKVFERVIRKQVFSYLSEHNFLNKTLNMVSGEDDHAYQPCWMSMMTLCT